MDPFEGTPLWETWNERTSEFTHFNLVIRLSIVKQLAFSAALLFDGRMVEELAAVPGFTVSLNLDGITDRCRNLLFLVQLKLLQTFRAPWQATGTWLFPQVWSTLVFGEVETSCAPNS